ncbi:MAG TPA: SRPBCC family protein, partial [Gemmatimonadales bacterium]|nr:SRPBCC family protein [Gemmatimonadales bacterium]
PSGGHTSPVSSVARGEGVKLERRITVDRPAAELYRYWHNLENLPQFMEHLESVTVLDDRRSHWVSRAPAGARVEWDAEIHNDIPDELIAWRSLPGSDVANAGSVHFRPIGDGHSTEVQVVLSYEPPAGRLGATIAKLFGGAPGQQVEEDLQRFKLVMETGQGAATDS